MKHFEQHYISLLLLALMVTPLSAQLFGSARQIGRPLRQQQQDNGLAGQVAQEAGEVQGDERFLRNNRRRGDFVGSDRFEGRGFVGSEQGRTTGPVLTSTAGVRPARDRSRQINRPLPRLPRKQAYYPSLEFQPEVAGVRFPGLLKRDLENPAYFADTNQYEVLVEGRRAILRGVVVDARQRDLAELLVSFEPGISEVINELQLEQTRSEAGRRPDE